MPKNYFGPKVILIQYRKEHRPMSKKELLVIGAGVAAACGGYYMYTQSQEGNDNPTTLAKSTLDSAMDTAKKAKDDVSSKAEKIKDGWPSKLDKKEEEASKEDKKKDDPSSK